MAKKHVRRKRTTRDRWTGLSTAPGTVDADPTLPPGKLHAIAYDAGSCVERTVESIAELDSLRAGGKILWLDVTGLGDARLIEAIGARFRMHPLALEDVVHVHQRAKVEEYDTGLFVVARMPHIEDGQLVDLEQVSIFLGEDFVLTFQERSGDCFDPLRERMRHAKGRVRRSGADYLAYALLDAVIDAYFPLAEQFGERLESVEDNLLEDPTPDAPKELHALRRELLAARRAIWPLREALNHLMRTEQGRLTAETRIYLRDAYDHTIRLAELIDSHRELAAGLMELYLSSVSNRMNEVMKVLTIISTIFIPLSFVAGVYGMNFDPDTSPFNMPELRARFGYPFAMGLMALISGGLLVFFRRRRWI
ncbi:MAG: magnesium/cobalt transporter CorA [Myxococcota bacterium]|nr:magnesium/cobalt transporter CorA [Myxococcota bacterium]